MRKNLLLLITITILNFGFLSSQSISEDFESYEVGSYIGDNSDVWTTWSGTTGTNEDAKIVDDKAKSGNNSIYFYGTGEGPQDVILFFGDKYTTGIFELDFSIFISEGSSAYWNFQQELTLGQFWAGNAYYRNNGLLEIDAGGKSLMTIFNSGEWNDISYYIDLDNNEWIISVNDQCVGTLLAPASISSLDIFPITSNSSKSEFWIDDVSYNYNSTSVMKNLDVVLSETFIEGIAFKDTIANLGFKAVNTGTDTIKNLEIEVVINSGTPVSKNVNDINLASGEEIDILFDEILTYIDGINTVNVDIKNINGIESDELSCNNKIFTGVKAITPAKNKAVVVEEGTGTWCQWCPRGAVFMERMEEKYRERFVGIAVHNRTSDPMLHVAYDAYVTSFPGFGGFPGAIVDRETSIDPSGIEAPIIERLQQPVDETFEVSATYDEGLKNMVVTVKVNAINTISANKKLVVSLKEDGVTGTSAGYRQFNAYAGGGSGVMGGYENLPNPVPANQMVYDIVARELLTPAKGMALEGEIEAGTSAELSLEATIDESWNLENMSIVVIMLNQDNKASNAMEFDVDEVTELVDNKNYSLTDYKIDLFPNPANNFTNLSLDLGIKSEVSITLMDLSGKIVFNKNYGTLQGKQFFPINTINLNNGIYNALVRINGEPINQKVVVTH